jgi:phage-related protein
MRQPKKVPAVFFCTDAGAEPVRDWLKELPAADRRVVGFDIATAEFGWPIGMPICRSLSSGLWEIRSRLAGGRIARVFFCIDSSSIFLLHGIIKKTQKTPKGDLDLARKRQKELDS